MQELFRLERHVVDVRDIGERVGEGELHRLDLQVHALDRVDRHRRDVEILEDAERDQRDDALAVGRDLVQRVAAIVLLERPDPVVLVRREVRGAHRRAVLLRERLDFLGELAAIERFAARRGDLLERRRVLGQLEHLAHRRRLAAGQERLGEAGMNLELGRLRRPLPGDGRGDEKALASIADRRLEQALEGQLAEFLMELDPGRNTARHAHRVPAAHRHPALLGEVFRRPGRGRAPRGVQAVQLFSVPDDRVGVRADAVRDRLYERQRDGRGEDRIHRGAARGEHLQPRLRRERLRGGHDIAREHRLARPRIREFPVEGQAHAAIVRAAACSPLSLRPVSLEEADAPAPRRSSSSNLRPIAACAESAPRSCTKARTT